ncbi:MAG: hypothetical protein FWF84_06445, partial [Kiritimatiellaeota bacterium]|nr:hypothetical protein [Kiritimatiellota bacterium]
MKKTIAKPERPCQNHRMGRRPSWIILATALSCGNALGNGLGNGLGNDAAWDGFAAPGVSAWEAAIVLFAVAGVLLPFILPLWRSLRRTVAGWPRRARVLAVFAVLAVTLHGGQKGAQPKPGADPNTLFPPVIASVPAKQPSAPSRQSLLTPDFVPGMRPAWWHYDMTDSCGCGMPDLWRKWVRLDPCGHDLDRDNDGLTEL